MKAPLPNGFVRLAWKASVGYSWDRTATQRFWRGKRKWVREPGLDSDTVLREEDTTSAPGSQLQLAMKIAREEPLMHFPNPTAKSSEYCLYKRQTISQKRLHC